MIMDISVYSSAYNLMAIKARKWERFITLFIGIAGTVTGTEGLVVIVANKELPLWATALGFILNAMVAILSIVLSVWDLGDTAASARSAECSYIDIKNQLDTQLALPREKRRDPRKLLNEVRDNMKSIQLSAPIINTSLRRQASVLGIQFESDSTVVLPTKNTESHIIELLRNYDKS